MWPSFNDEGEHLLYLLGVEYDVNKVTCQRIENINPLYVKVSDRAFNYPDALSNILTCFRRSDLEDIRRLNPDPGARRLPAVVIPTPLRPDLNADPDTDPDHLPPLTSPATPPPPPLSPEALLLDQALEVVSSTTMKLAAATTTTTIWAMKTKSRLVLHPVALRSHPTPDPGTDLL